MFKKKQAVETSGKSDPGLSKPVGGSPYLDARQEWLERYGSYIQRAAHWRMAAFGSMLLAGAALAACIVMAGQYKVVPYMAAIDDLGRVAVSRADVAAPPPVRLIQAELANFIITWRTVTADLDLQKKNLSRLSYFAAGAAKGQIREWFEQNNPYQIIKDNKLVQLNIKGLPHQVSQDSWRVEWTETIRNFQGGLMESNNYEATLTIAVVPPDTEEKVLKNPGGIYVTNLTFSRVIDTPK